MRLTLKTIRWRNFLATGNQWTEIELYHSKTTLIVGKNGSGKSTLLDALFFALFNRPFRRINKPQLVNAVNGKDCVVELEFDVNGHPFKVIRGIKPNVFEIYKGEELLTQTADHRDYQEAFEKYIIKINHKTFSQIVVLGSAIFVPFMALPAAGRREVIEDILSLEIFTKMNVVLKQKLDVVYNELHDAKHKKELLDQNYQLTKEHSEQITRSKDERLTELATKHAEICKSLDDCNLLIQQINGKLSFGKYEYNEDTANKNKTDFTKVQAQLQHKEQQLNREILFLKNNAICPICHQGIDETFKQEQISEKEGKSLGIATALRQIDKKLAECFKQLETIEKNRKYNQGIEKELGEANYRKGFLKSQAENISNEMKQVKEESFQNDFDKLEELKMALQEINMVIEGLATDQTTAEYAAILLKDSGIKAKIIKTFIPVMNQLIAKYLAELDFFIGFTLSETFEEKILSRHRDNFSYNSFSEGQKCRLNLAILFAWRAMARLRSSVDISLLVFDEIFDSSLDEDGMDYLVKLIANMTGNDNIIIISHKEQMFDKFEKVVKFEDVKGFSRIAA